MTHDRAPPAADPANPIPTRPGGHMPMPLPSLISGRSTPETDETDRLRSSWRYRVCEAAGVFDGRAGEARNRSALAMLVTAVLGVGGNRRPRLVGPAMIAANGVVMVKVVVRDGRVIPVAPLGTVAQYVAAFRRVADVLKLSSAETEELFGEARKWIGRDLRVAATQREELAAGGPVDAD